jgi:hypothetical protein
MIVIRWERARARWRATVAASLLLGTLWACSGGNGDACGGLVAPVRVLTPTPVSLALLVGTTGQVAVSLSGGCPGDDPTITWTSSAPAVASVDATGLVSALGTGTATITASAVGGQVRTSIVVTTTPRIATTIDAQPVVDTLSPLGTRQMTVIVRDQQNVVLPAPALVWRSLTPTVATVNGSGLVTAVASGTAAIEVSTPRVSPDSLRDTVSVLVVPACSLVRPVTPGGTITGAIDASTCQNLFGYRVANQYSVTAATQLTFSLRLVPTRAMVLVPLNIGAQLFGFPAADTAVTGIVVLRPGTFGFMVAAEAPAPGTFSVTSVLNPDPRLLCVTTAATTGVTFSTAVTPTCTARDVRILPAFTVGQQVRITATAPSYPVTIELLNAAGLTVIQRVTAANAGAIATINFTNTTARSGVLRVFGGANINDLVTIVIQ